MKEKELKEKLVNALFKGLENKVSSSIEVSEIGSRFSDSKFFMCRFALNDEEKTKIALVFRFHKTLLSGFLPAEYKIATIAKKCIPSTILAFVYPRSGFKGFILSHFPEYQRIIFVPIYDTKQFDSDYIFRERKNWYPLIETLNEDDEIAKWFKEMPMETRGSDRKLRLDVGGSSSDYSKCICQLVPIAKKKLTSVGLNCISQWKTGWTGAVNGIDLTFVGIATKIIQRINKHIVDYAFQGEPAENVIVPDPLLISLSGETLKNT
jgi:hypothetical protein